MNKKLLLAALAVPMAFTACTEDFQVENPVSNETVLMDGKIQLGENFVLGVGRDNLDAESRSAWFSGTNAEGNGGLTQMYWIPKNATNVSLADYSNGVSDEYVKDAVGLCYVSGNEILTNYKFDHDGWVKSGESLKNAPYKCIEGVRYYSRNYLRFAGMAKNKAVIDAINADLNSKFVEGTLSEAVSSAIEDYDEAVMIEKLNLARGIFKTQEKTIFAGDYVAYYPWSNAMLEAGNLTATAPVKMSFESGEYADRVNALNKYTFMAGWIGNIDGGTEAAEMSLYQVSKLLALTLEGVGHGTDKIVLLDPQGNFINKMELTIDQVKAKSANGTAVEKSQIVMIDFPTGLVDACKHPAEETHTHTTVYVPMFETTIPAGTYVLAINSTTGSTKAYQTTAAVDFTNVDLAKGIKADLVDFAYNVVTNEEELIAANASASEKPILLLGDIELKTTGTKLGKKTIVGYIGDTKVGSLVMPAVDTSNYVIYANGTTFDCDVLVEAKGCCHTAAGELYLHGITLNADRTITNQNKVFFRYDNKSYIYGTLNNEPYVTPDEEGLTYVAYRPEMSVAAKAKVYVYGELNNKAAEDVDGNDIQSYIKIESDINTADGIAKNDGEISVVKNGSLSNYGWIDNYGTMTNQTGVTAQIMNNEGATYVLKIGGQLTGALLKNADNRRCDFIAEVDNSTDSRWATAWSQGLANIIKIVKEQNSTYKNIKDRMYPFKFNDAEGNSVTVNNRNVQVVVENPSIWFVGENITNPKDDAVDSPVAATIGRLIVNNAGIVSINKEESNAQYNTVQLKVDNSTWAGNECAAGAAENAISVKANARLNHNCEKMTGKTALKNVRLSVIGDFDVTGIYNERAYLSQNGVLNANAGGKIKFDAKTYFTIDGGIVATDEMDSKEYGIFFEENVIGSLTDGDLTVNEKSYLQIAEDAVIRVTDNVFNNGLVQWISRTGTKSPGIIYCKSFEASDPANWLNGTPTNN